MRCVVIRRDVSHRMRLNACEEFASAKKNFFFFPPSSSKDLVQVRNTLFSLSFGLHVMTTIETIVSFEWVFAKKKKRSWTSKRRSLLT
jgi:hypothetical protein